VIFLLTKPIYSYPGTSSTTQVLAVYNRGQIKHMTSITIKTALQDGVKAYGKAKL
jgi:hypothetical protein